jgi:hypothetical protein
MKLCNQHLTAEGEWQCVDCGAGPYKVPCSRNCGVKPSDNKPAKPKACPLCGRVLDPEHDKRSLARDGGRIHWWCPACHISCGECRTCNSKPKGKNP